ncbi:UNVERIFIED_CONTAM: hypothetical protein RKD50_007194 [Streptomyces canus]
MNGTRTSANTPPNTPPYPRSTGEPELAQQMASPMTIEAHTISGPVPTRPDRAEAGSTAPAATLAAESTAKVTATAADCR